MTKPLRYLAVIFAAVALFTGASCTQQRLPCMEPRMAVLNIKTLHFKLATDTKPVDTGLPSAVFIALTQQGKKGLIFSTASSFNLSLSSVSDSSVWTFSTDSLTKNTIDDTLVFYHRRNLHFISNACGYTYYFDLDSVHSTKNNIDSLRIMNPEVTNNVNTNHLQIYIRHDH